MTKKSIFVYTLYIITIYLVSIIFIIFSANAEQTNTKEPFDIWAEDSLLPINENDTEDDEKIDENINKTIMKLITIFGLLDLCFLFFVSTKSIY